MKTIIRRHGDVILKTNKEFKAPPNLKWKVCKVLHKGNNHDHYFSKGEVIESSANGKKYIRVKKDALISHGRGKSSEHATKPVPKGDYLVEIQTEFDHLKKISRQVID